MTERREKVKSRKFSHWIRLYTSVRHDPKIVCLNDWQFRKWVLILTVAGDSDDGILPCMAHLACELRCTQPEATKLCNDLIDMGLLDIVRRHEDGVLLRPHNWDGRQYRWDCADPTAAERSKRYRNRKKTEASRSRHGRATEISSDSASVSDSASDVEQVDTEVILPGEDVSKGTYPRNAYARARDGGEL